MQYDLSFYTSHNQFHYKFIIIYQTSKALKNGLLCVMQYRYVNVQVLVMLL